MLANISDKKLSSIKQYVFLFNAVWVLLVLIFVKSYDMRFAAVNCLFELLFFYWLGVYIDFPYNNKKIKILFFGCLYGTYYLLLKYCGYIYDNIENNF